MELHKTKEQHIYYYFNAAKEKCFMYRYRYTDEITGKQKEKKRRKSVLKQKKQH